MHVVHHHHHVTNQAIASMPMHVVGMQIGELWRLLHKQCPACRRRTAVALHCCTDASQRVTGTHLTPDVSKFRIF
jgi:hypothetical protein